MVYETTGLLLLCYFRLFPRFALASLIQFEYRKNISKITIRRTIRRDFGNNPSNMPGRRVERATKREA